ncbi:MULTISPECIES: choice-of-anchor L domain-containing protein [Chryseobacterium]|uniref:choice-of-anchor L domain-containing protein n=1 Tax=Chryseobacterium TaxID=59732 RepID=UPI001BEC2B36|nr:MULTISPECIES: choice-of-anchor L domain-containing protein [Chryseobacterium]MBT2620199.1 gliding motility-associated C-terminal domain-containing protein [Chryseobacterium sp. ISL-6]
MKRYLLLFSFFLISLNFYHSQTTPARKPQVKKLSASAAKAGTLIDVNAPGYNESNFTMDQLVRDVLISSGTNSCVTPSVTNVVVTPNLPASDVDRAWGYFHRSTSSFPFKDGIVLVTGKANRTGNTPDTGLSDVVGTGSDPDLVAATNPSKPLFDAVILEFDFVPTSSQVKFNYLMASEEYTGSYPCGFADSFALLIRPSTGGPYTNMAVLPSGGGPVSITNIHPEITGFGGCPAINETFFAGYNPPISDTNINGRTIPLTATATVVAGQQYHFKMVIADAGDTSFDSAVFLEGGSFNIGVDLLDPSGATLPSDINVCDNVPQVITASVSDPNLLYQWFFNGTPVTGATTNTITAIQPGTYTIEVSVPGNPCPGKASIQIHGGTTPNANDATLLLCTTPDITTFDLVAAMPTMSTTPNAVFHFYENQADAIAQNDNYITTPLSYNGNDGQILYVVVSNGGFCSRMVELKLFKEASPTAHVVSTKLKICPGDSVNLTATGGVTYQWSNFTGTGNTQTVTLYNTTTFTVYAVGAKGCKSLQPATVTVEVVPEIVSPLKDVEMCIGDRVTLDAGAGPNYKYLWSTGATTQTIFVDQLGIYSVTIDNGYCTKVFTSKVMAATLPFITGLDYNNSNTLTITAVNPSINNNPGVLEYSADGGVSWQTSNVFPGLIDNTTYNLQVRIQGTHCVGTLDFFTLKISNVITPNQDGINDVLDLKSLGDFDNFTGSIYDRYGVEMFRFTKQNPVWDGTVGGKRLSTATYWYKFNFQYPKSKAQMNWSGWIMLKNRE